jgi:hypothetical protein
VTHVDLAIELLRRLDRDRRRAFRRLDFATLRDVRARQDVVAEYVVWLRRRENGEARADGGLTAQVERMAAEYGLYV